MCAGLGSWRRAGRCSVEDEDGNNGVKGYHELWGRSARMMNRSRPIEGCRLEGMKAHARLLKVTMKIASGLSLGSTVRRSLVPT